MYFTNTYYLLNNKYFVGKTFFFFCYGLDNSLFYVIELFNCFEIN